MLCSSSSCLVTINKESGKILRISNRFSFCYKGSLRVDYTYFLKNVVLVEILLLPLICEIRKEYVDNMRSYYDKHETHFIGGSVSLWAIE